jgi:NAD+ synthase
MMESTGTPQASPLRLNTRIVRDLLVRFLKDETTNAGFSNVVLGISGGVDSALAAALAVEAFGNEHVRGVMMPYRTSNPQSVKDALEVFGQLGIRPESVDITAMVDAYCIAENVTDSVRRGNIMARARMIVLYDISAREKALVVGTSNKTEIMVGYGTLHGDTACAINPLGDLYKTQVWQLAEAVGVPKHIISKAPTADLWEGQTDEGELGISYKPVDEILFQIVDERRTDDEILQMKFDASLIARVRELIRKNQFKRRPPLIAKISYRTVNVDFNYARDWGI